MKRMEKLLLDSKKHFKVSWHCMYLNSLRQKLHVNIIKINNNKNFSGDDATCINLLRHWNITT